MTHTNHDAEDDRELSTIDLTIRTDKSRRQGRKDDHVVDVVWQKWSGHDLEYVDYARLY